MVSLITVSNAQKKLADHMRQRRIDVGLTQQGLAQRSGVRLSTLRKFEQKSLISLESFLKIAMVFEWLENIVNVTKPTVTTFKTIDDVLSADKNNKKRIRQKGWRT